MSDKPKIICVGHVCIDRNTTEHAQYVGWGSPSLYMSSYFKKHGLTSQVVASYGPDLLPYVPEFSLLPTEPNMAETLTFENIIHPDEPRRWYAHKVEMSLPPPLTPDIEQAIAAADMLIATMLVPTYSAQWLADALAMTKSSCLKVLYAQGCVAKVGPGGLISPREFEEARDMLPLFDLMFISEDDTPDAVRVAQGWKRLAPETEIIVTNGPLGATIIGVDDVKNIPTTPIQPEQIIDSVGAGDVFAAAVSLAYSGGASLEEAILAGHEAAGRKLTTRKSTAVPSCSSR